MKENDLSNVIKNIGHDLRFHRVVDRDAYRFWLSAQVEVSGLELRQQISVEGLNELLRQKLEAMKRSVNEEIGLAIAKLG